MDEKKNIEVVTGDGLNLEISRVSKHLNVGKPTPTSKKPKNVVIPKEIHKSNKNNNDNDDDDDSNK